MSKPSRRAKKPKRRSKTTTLVHHSNDHATESPAASRKLPIVAAYAPPADAWSVSGFGTAGITRQRPDGGLVTAYFNISLIDGGLIGMFGNRNTTAEEDEKLRRDLAELSPPFVPAHSNLAARFIWGAYAWSLDAGYDWPEEEVRHYLGVVPPLSGSRNWWLEQFCSPDLTPPGLLRVARENETPEDVPEGKELVCFTTMTFSHTDFEFVSGKLNSVGPDFASEGIENGVEFFNWTRKYPKGHWSPLALLGGRQVLGSVEIGPSYLKAQAKTLSMAARLIQSLKELLGDRIILQDTKWAGIRDLVKGTDADAR